MVTLRDLQTKAREYFRNGSNALAYVYANEALLRTTDGVLPPTRPLAVGCMVLQARQTYLHRALPVTHLLDEVEDHLKKAQESMAVKDYEKALDSTTAARERERFKTPAPLILLADICLDIQSFKMAYVFASEALALMTGGDHYTETLRLAAKKGLPGYDGIPEPEWSSNEEVVELTVTWDLSSKELPNCILQREDLSRIIPKVPFNDLPTFFANHASADSPVRNIYLPFIPSSLRGYPRPTEDQLQVLIETSKCTKENSSGDEVPLFSNVKVAMIAYADFHDIEEDTFYQLFDSLLAAPRLTIVDLKRLPRDVQPAAFLQHPSLLACPTLVFTKISLDIPWLYDMLHEFIAPVEVKFTPAAVLAHLKARTIDAERPQLYFHADYIEDGVVAMAQEVRNDFDATTRGNATTPFSPADFYSVISYNKITSDDQQRLKDLCGELTNSLGERLQIAELPWERTEAGPLDTHQIGIRKCKPNVEESQKVKPKNKGNKAKKK